LKTYDTALACFKRCLALGQEKTGNSTISYPLDLTNAKALTGLGHCYFKKRAYTQAARCLERSVLLKNDPSAQAMLVAARALIKKNAVHT
jgi:tetratricopeptide (TPR) repeat protein